MQLHHSFLTAISGLKTNKVRSVLTMLGIVIGITAIMLIVSTGRGAQSLILSQIQGLGSKTIVVIPGREPKGPSDAAQIFSDSLRGGDLELLGRKENAPNIARVAPIVFGGDSASYGSETFRLTIFGSAGLISDIFDLAPDKGEFLTDDDVRSRSDVVVIGSKVKEELFGAGEALGERIRIKGRSLRVVGILSQKGQVSFFNFDEAAIIPYTTAQQYIFGIKFFHRFIAEAISDDKVDAGVKDIELTLRESHNITDPDKDDFFVQTQADLAERIGVITNALTLFLASVAAISLIVGGIGIMNIMLVSVAERTREIGLRKAIGATSRDILIQYLLESMLLTAIGGAIGIALGSLLSFAASLIIEAYLGNWTFSYPFGPALLGLAVSAGVGLIFGLYPARTAARKSPIEACGMNNYFIFI